jgi:hypothetical protein
LRSDQDAFAIRRQYQQGKPLSLPGFPAATSGIKTGKILSCIVDNVERMIFRDGYASPPGDGVKGFVEGTLDHLKHKMLLERKEILIGG